MFGSIRARGRTNLRDYLDITQAPKTLQKIEGFNAISSFTPTNPAYTWSAVLNNDGKVYFGVMAKNINFRDPLVYKFSRTLNLREVGYRVTVGVQPLNADTHRVPNFDVDSSGNIWMVCELLSATEGHGTDVLVYKTSTPYDITTLTLNNTLTGSWTYPFIKISGSNIFISARGDPGSGFSRKSQWYWNSTNGGSSFGSPVELYDSGDEDKVAYCWAQHDFSGGICIVLNERDNVLGNWTFVSLVKGSFNNNVWSNAGGTVTKNVSSVAAFTRTEMMTDNLVMQSSDFNTVAVNHEGGYIKSDGSIKMLVSVQTLTGNDFEGNPETELDELRFYNFSGGSWSFENVTIPGSTITFYWAYQRYWCYMPNDDVYDDILFIDPTSDNDVYLKRSTDNFATETQRLQLEGNGKYRLGTYAFNVPGIADYFVVLVSTEGDLFEITDETVLDYSNLFLFQNFAAP